MTDYKLIKQIVLENLYQVKSLEELTRLGCRCFEEGLQGSETIQNAAAGRTLRAMEGIIAKDKSAWYELYSCEDYVKAVLLHKADRDRR